MKECEIISSSKAQTLKLLPRYACTSAGWREHMEVHRLASRALALNCNSPCVTAELFYVVLHPPQRCHLVLHCVITWCLVVSSTQKSCTTSIIWYCMVYDRGRQPFHYRGPHWLFLYLSSAAEKD
jgi:hypothetical protein